MDITYAPISKKNFCVKGDKDKYDSSLKLLGKYSKNRTGGDGWIVPVEKEEELKKLIKSLQFVEIEAHPKDCKTQFKYRREQSDDEDDEEEVMNEDEEEEVKEVIIENDDKKQSRTISSSGNSLKANSSRSNDGSDDDTMLSFYKTFADKSNMVDALSDSGSEGGSRGSSHRSYSSSSSSSSDDFPQPDPKKIAERFNQLQRKTMKLEIKQKLRK